MAVTELGVHNGDVPQGDVLIDEVLVHGALHIVCQLGPADAAGVGGAEEGRVRLLGRADPDRELLRGLHPDVLIQNIGDSSPNRLIAASKLHIDSLRMTQFTRMFGSGQYLCRSGSYLPSVVHIAVPKSDVVDPITGANGSYNQANPTCIDPFKQHVFRVIL